MSLRIAAKFFGEGVGQAMWETGQALQRVGLRVSGNHVIKPDAFKYIGVQKPFVVSGAEVDTSATLVGKVNVSSFATVGQNCVLRGEHFEVNVGPKVKVGENTIISSGSRNINGLPPTVELGLKSIIGDNVVLESCLVGNEAVIGSNSVVSQGCIIESCAVLEPGTVVPPLHRIPAKQVWGGNPARYVKDVEAH